MGSIWQGYRVRTIVNGNEPLRSVKDVEFFECMGVVHV